MSILHDKLLDKDKEVEVLKEELKKSSDGRRSLPPKIGPNSPMLKNQARKRVTIAVQENYTEEEFFSQEFSTSEEDTDDDESDSYGDPEWRRTPMFKRIKAERRSLGAPIYKRKRGSSVESGKGEDESQSIKKRNSATQGEGFPYYV